MLWEVICLRLYVRDVTKSLLLDMFLLGFIFGFIAEDAKKIRKIHKRGSMDLGGSTEEEEDKPFELKERRKGWACPHCHEYLETDSQGDLYGWGNKAKRASLEKL